MNCAILDSLFQSPPIDMPKEISAYEYLWQQHKASFKTIAELFHKNPNALPSELVGSDKEISYTYELLKKNIKNWDFNLLLNGSIDYPLALKDAKHPVELLYYKGWLDLLSEPKRIAIVGSRNLSDAGVIRTKKLTRLLVENNYTIFSGLARGVDTTAHIAAIENGGKTVGVIGTPITDYYPKENKELQDFIAKEHLLISQVPIQRYHSQDFRLNRFFFPERNATMSALSQATVIVEAGETSGSLTQARAALHQGRKLFILESCFQNPNITWPARFEKQGAIRVREIEDILENLECKDLS